MNLIIDDDVKMNLKRRGRSTITIDYGILSSCWSIMPQVFIKGEGTADSSQYSRHEANDMTVFIKNDLILDDEVRVRFPQVASDLSGQEFEAVGATPPVQ